MSNAAANFNILAINLSVLRNYFNGPTKLFSDLSVSGYIFRQHFSKTVLFLNNSIFPCDISMLILIDISHYSMSFRKLLLR